MRRAALARRHLDDEIRAAFIECRRVLAPGGVLLVSVRDYAAIERRSPDRRSYGTRRDGGCDDAAEQIWSWDGDQYDVVLRLIEQCGSSATIVHEFHSRYCAVELPTLERLLREAGLAPQHAETSISFNRCSSASIRLIVQGPNGVTPPGGRSSGHSTTVGTTVLAGLSCPALTSSACGSYAPVAHG